MNVVNLKNEANYLITLLQMQALSAPTIFMTNHDLMTLIRVLKDYLVKINPGCNSECKELIGYLEGQAIFSPNLHLPEEHINVIVDYLKTYIEFEDTEKEPYIPKTEEKALYGKCVLQIRFENEDEYKKWKEFNQRYKWGFDHTYPAIMRAEYEFHTVYDVELMTKEIVSLLEMGFDVRAVDWKVKEFKSQLK